jgi:hypothetical protein
MPRILHLQKIAKWLLHTEKEDKHNCENTEKNKSHYKDWDSNED